MRHQIQMIENNQKREANELIQNAQTLFDSLHSQQDREDEEVILDDVSKIQEEFDYFGKKLDNVDPEADLDAKSWKDLFLTESDPEKRFMYLSKWIEDNDPDN